ncbi:MAG: DUF433 domain-containing protein [Anaerolineae bacterium]|nr:DUF433 domain-containing protein [Anaerolineae bacterium]
MPVKAAILNSLLNLAKQPRAAKQGRPACCSNASTLERIRSTGGGQPVIKGTRLTVEYILNLLAHDATSAEILKEYKGLTQEDIRLHRHASEARTPSIGAWRRPA